MISNHQRNVSGMHRARRCEALTSSNEPCRAPAVKGKKRCHHHGGSGSKRSYATKFGDYSKATLLRDRETRAEIKRLDRLIRKLEREGAPAEHVAEAHAIRRRLRDQTQQKEADLAQSYTPSEAELHVASHEAALAAFHSHAHVSGHSSLGMVLDRARGAMLGLAVGEALGITLEHRPRDSFREYHDVLGGGVLGLEPGEWAADTATARALMESLTRRRGFDETDFIERLIEWEEDGVFSCTGTPIGIDGTTRAALARYRRFEDPIAGDPDPQGLSNTSLVRVAPVAIRYWNDRAALLDVAARQSRVTHGGPCAVSACAAFADILADAIEGCDRKTLLRVRYPLATEGIRAIFARSWKHKERYEIASDNNVLHSLEAALWCVDRTEAFDDALILAANLGEDATTAAITGQLAGAHYGLSTICASWLYRLALHDTITEEVEALFAQSGEEGAR